MTLKKLLLIGAVSLSLSSCGDDEIEPVDSTATVTTESKSQLANPASEYCIAQGGTVEIVDEVDGQCGYCNLPDGRRVEEWEFYNSSDG